MDFLTFHRYNELARLGLVKPLACPICENRVALILGEDDEPALKCFYCGTLTVPGLNWYSDVRAVVKEFYE